MNGFHHHIREAITVNLERKLLYAALSNDQTRFLSNVFIGLEYLSLPITKYYDRKGRFFNKMDIMIIKNDFVPMDIIAPHDQEVIFKKPYNNRILERINFELRTYRNKIDGNIRNVNDLEKYLAESIEFYNYVSELEKIEEVNFAMTKHMVESIAFVCKNGIKYANQSEGKTIPLSRSLIKLHNFALKNTMFFDKKANPFHMKNIGIIVNDLPKIDIH